MSTKYFDLFSALKAGGERGVSPEALQKALDFSVSALAVYIHALRHKFGAQIESVRNGRTVVAYRLTNIAEMEKVILPSRKPRTTKAKPAKAAKAPKVAVARVVKTTRAPKKTARVVDDGSIPVLDADLDIAEIGSNELDDIRHSLGI